MVAIAVPTPRAIFLMACALAALWASLMMSASSGMMPNWSLSSLWATSPPENSTQLAAPSPTAGTDHGVEDREAIVKLIRGYRRQTKESWRQRLADAIYYESVDASVDPLLVASIVATESSFHSRVKSRAGAVGLMQLRPHVAREVARDSSIEWKGLATLHSPDHNVQIGVQYYKELLDRFDGDVQVALTAYNYGPTRVSRQLANGTYSGSDYANEILSLYETLNRRRAA
jgi:soluble lytic murein transglycosylase-like protein